MSMAYRLVGLLATGSGVVHAAQGRDGWAVFELVVGVLVYGCGWYRDRVISGRATDEQGDG